jgi:large subunit ribosomal protein LX
MNMAQVKVFRVEGEIRKPGHRSTFTKELRAMTEKEALERIYSLFGGGEKLKRFQITINQIKEIDPSEAKNIVVRALSGL